VRATFEVRRLLDRIARRFRPAPAAPPTFGRYTEFWEGMARQYKAQGQVYRTIGAATQADFVDASRVLYWGCVHNGLRPESRILDIGCGTGRLAVALQDYIRPPGAYWGVDVSATLVEEARRTVVRPNFTFLVNEALPLPLPDRSLDFVVLFSVFTHLYVEDVVAFLREIRRLLADSGRCLATVLADPTIGEAAGTIGEMRHNVDFVKRLVAREGLRVASVQQHWGLPFVDRPDEMTQDARVVSRDEGGRQTCLLIVPT
jgi:SAM-dependent methyltransferase